MNTMMIQYRFGLPDGSREDFHLEIDPQTLELHKALPAEPPEWARLNFHQCPNCPLSIAAHPYCPQAAGLLDVVKRVDHLISHDRIRVEVITTDRTIVQDTTAQNAISSLLGLIIATSGCPHTAYFKPMARFHLPLANDVETIYRATSMYLLAQYFVGREGKKPDLDLEGLSEIYRRIHIVNTAMAERLRAATCKDSTINAIVILDMYALAIPHIIHDSLEDLRSLFTPYLNG